jgi:hypothetical protein
MTPKSDEALPFLLDAYERRVRAALQAFNADPTPENMRRLARLRSQAAALAARCVAHAERLDLQSQR